MSDTLESPPIPPETPAFVLDSNVPNEPPPPYPSRERRRALRAGRRRRTGGDPEHLQIPSTHSDADYEYGHHTPATSPFPDSADIDHEPTENTPLLASSPRLPPGGISRRQRTLSISSTLHSVTSATPSFAHTVISAFHPERDCDLDPDVCIITDHDSDGHDFLDSPTARHSHEHEHEDQSRIFAAELSSGRIVRRSTEGRWRRYFRPITRRAYYSALFHLLCLNFPFALLAWVYLFVFTLVRLSIFAFNLQSSRLPTSVFRVH